MNIDFGANKTPVEVIKEDAFGGTCFRDVFCSVNNKWYRKSWKEFDELNNIDRGYWSGIIFGDIIMMLMLINMVLNVKHH